MPIGPSCRSQHFGDSEKPVMLSIVKALKIQRSWRRHSRTKISCLEIRRSVVLISQAKANACVCDAFPTPLPPTVCRRPKHSKFSNEISASVRCSHRGPCIEWLVEVKLDSREAEEDARSQKCKGAGDSLYRNLIKNLIPQWEIRFPTARRKGCRFD